MTDAESPPWRTSPFVRNFRYRLHGPLFRDKVVPRTGVNVASGVGGPMQIAPDTVCMPVQRRVYGCEALDFDDGTDLFIFRGLERLKDADVTPLVSNHPETNPNNGNAEVMSHFQAYGGFVPLYAKLDSGAPHPAAGTGFMVSLAIGYPASLHTQHTPEFQPDCNRHFKIFQLRFDGKQMHVSRPVVVEQKVDKYLRGWCWHLLGLSHAIPDGVDLINGVECYPPGSPTRRSAGVGRWRFVNGEWRMIDFTPAAPGENAREPSLVRDADGSLLMCLRGAGSNAPSGFVHDGIENTYQHLRVSRSTDGGRTWVRVIHNRLGRAPTPIAIIRAHNGSMHLLGNPYRPLRTDSRGRKVTQIMQREELTWWRVTSDRMAVEEAVTLIDSTHEFGPVNQAMIARGENMWWLDHPIGGAFRLSDGAWRTLVGFRCTDSSSARFGSGISPSHGVYLLELELPGEAQPPWRF